MKNTFRTMTLCSLGLAVAILTVGCGPKSDGKSSSDGNTGKTGGDAHPSKGPNKGDLIHLDDNHMYHAEFLHDEEGGTVTIHILDKTAIGYLPIKAKQVVINLKHEGEPETFTLTASPQKSDPKDLSSRFVLKEAGDLAHALEHGEEAEPILQVSIKGQQYSGDVHHEHGEDHNHEKTEKSD
jgi:hypothetical protein